MTHKSNRKTTTIIFGEIIKMKNPNKEKDINLNRKSNLIKKNNTSVSVLAGEEKISQPGGRIFFFWFFQCTSK